jgi:Glycosyl transferase family 2
MSEPTVCGLMLTADRHELASKAVACFLRQTYKNKALVIYDTGEKPLPVEVGDNIAHLRAPERGLPIGALRNNANRFVGADIIVHWDDDDWSHPNRIAEQVAFLQESGAQAVGYNELLFWREPQTWLYTHTRQDYAAGTSLCYWRKTWEGKQFRDDFPQPNGTGEDHEWIQGLTVHATSGLVGTHPRIVARIHGRNTSGAYQNIDESTSWTRAEGLDPVISRVMEAA